MHSCSFFIYWLESDLKKKIKSLNNAPARLKMLHGVYNWNSYNFYFVTLNFWVDFWEILKSKNHFLIKKIFFKENYLQVEIWEILSLHI